MRNFYDDKVEELCLKSIPEVFGLKEQEYLPSLAFCKGHEYVQAKALEHIRMTASSKAVICFGVEYLESETFGIDTKYAIFHRVCEESEDLSVL